MQAYTNDTTFMPTKIDNLKGKREKEKKKQTTITPTRDYRKRKQHKTD